MKSTILDVFLFVGLAFSGFLGYKDGFSKKIFSLLVLIGSIVASVYLMDPVGGIFQDFGISEPWCYLVSFAFVVIGLSVGVLYIYNRYGEKKAVKSSGQAVGALFGLIEGTLIISLVLMAMKIADVPSNGVRSGSVLYKPLYSAAPKMFDLLRPYLPGAGDFNDELGKKFKQLELSAPVPEDLRK